SFMEHLSTIGAASEPLLLTTGLGAAVFGLGVVGEAARDEQLGDAVEGGAGLALLGWRGYRGAKAARQFIAKEGLTVAGRQLIKPGAKYITTKAERAYLESKAAIPTATT